MERRSMWANQLAGRSTVTHYSCADHPEDAKLHWLPHFRQLRH
jgi:hypothetical protein